VPDQATSEESAETLRRQIAVIEEEHADRLAAAHTALAEAQDRYYWLDRWGIDLNDAMRRPGAVRARLLMRGARSVARAAIKLKRRTEQFPEQARRAYSRTEMDVAAITGEEGAASDGGFGRRAAPDPLRASPVTDLLFARLSDEDVAEIERRGADDMPETSDALERRRLLLSLGVHHRVTGVLERTGLTPAEPPEGVHSMSRGPLAAGGSPYYADLVADGFETAGAPIEAGMSCLDFGCSSGRVVRVLASAFEDCEWRGCDPIENAIAWARENIEGVEFLQSPQQPPLPYDDASFDRVYAISIWSHFSAPGAEAWLEEMRRIIRPGGALLMTTHGYQTVMHDHRTHRRSEEQLRSVRSGLYDEGHWFREEFGESGDHGVKNPDWGTAFMTPEWLLSRTAPHWSVGAFAPGRLEDNQDMYVLLRR
jgi:SAM-dependent methyltransferase